MRKLSTLTKGGIVSGAALAAAVGLVISPASAAPAATWTVSGSSGVNGAFTAVATNPTLTDTATGTQLKCAKSNASGTATNGSGKPPAGIAKITGVTWANCTGPLNIQFAVTAQNLPWLLNAGTYSSNVTTGTLTGVKAHISGLGCTADFGGATSGSTATLNASYSNTTHTLTVSGGNLHAYNVSGTCLGLINANDPAVYNAAYVVTPSTLKITSP